jgi:hypothetical protein
MRLQTSVPVSNCNTENFYKCTINGKPSSVTSSLSLKLDLLMCVHAFLETSLNFANNTMVRMLNEIQL